MTEERLYGLALLNIHKGADIIPENALKQFDSKGIICDMFYIILATINVI